MLLRQLGRLGPCCQAARLGPCCQAARLGPSCQVSAPATCQARGIFGWFDAAFNNYDPDRIREVGADRAAAEWLLRCGAGVRWHTGGGGHGRRNTMWARTGFQGCILWARTQLEECKDTVES